MTFDNEDGCASRFMSWQAIFLVLEFIYICIVGLILSSESRSHRHFKVCG